MSTSSRQIPRDAQVIQAILKDMGVTEYEPRVVNQLLEFVYRMTWYTFFYKINPPYSFIQLTYFGSLCLPCKQFPPSYSYALSTYFLLLYLWLIPYPTSIFVLMEFLVLFLLITYFRLCYYCSWWCKSLCEPCQEKRYWPGWCQTCRFNANGTIIHYSTTQRGKITPA